MNRCACCHNHAGVERRAGKSSAYLCDACWESATEEALLKAVREGSWLKYAELPGEDYAAMCESWQDRKRGDN